MTAIRMLAKFSSRCLQCDEMIVVGDPIEWEPGVGATHDECDGVDAMNDYPGSHEDVLGWFPGDS